MAAGAECLLSDKVHGKGSRLEFDTYPGTPPGLVNSACLLAGRAADILIANEPVLLNLFARRMRYQMEGSLLLSLGENLVIEQISQEERHVIVSVRSTAPTSRCPLCAAPSESIHSHYLRTVADLPCAG